MSASVAFCRGLARHPPPEDLAWAVFAWLEAPREARLARLADVPDWSDPVRWPGGRIFGEAGEYRWRTAPDGLHAVLLVEEGAFPVGFSGPLLLAREAGEGDSDLLLWGDWVDPAADPEGNPDGGPRFYAREIPQVQSYPLDLAGPPEAGTTPRLTVRRYVAASGEGEFLRCVRIAMRRDEGDEGDEGDENG